MPPSPIIITMSKIFWVGFLVVFYILFVSVGNQPNSTITIDENCLPWRDIITEEFYLIANGTCLSDMDETIHFICPLNNSDVFLGRILVGNLYPEGYIILNSPDRNTIAHEYAHAWQFFCARERFNVSDNWTTEGVAGLYADTREYNPIFAKENEDWLRRGLTHEEKVSLVNVIFSSENFVSAEWLWGLR